MRKGNGDWVARQAGEFYVIIARLPLSLMVANCELVLQMTRVKAFKPLTPNTNETKDYDGVSLVPTLGKDGPC